MGWGSRTTPIRPRSSTGTWVGPGPMHGFNENIVKERLGTALFLDYGGGRTCAHGQPTSSTCPSGRLDLGFPIRVQSTSSSTA